MTKTEASIVTDMIRDEAWVSPVMRNQLTGLLKMFKQGIPMNIRYVGRVYMVEARTSYDRDKAMATLDHITTIEQTITDNGWTR